MKTRPALKRAGWTAIAGVGVFTALFSLGTAFLLRRWLAREKDDVPCDGEPVTFFRPIKTGEPGLAENLELFLSAVGSEDQVIFAATGVEEYRLCEELAAWHSELEIFCLHAEEGRHRNPKINKLAQMEPFATRSKWIVLDSDAVAGRKFLPAFRGEWQKKKCTALSAPYAFLPARETPARLDALGTGLALWPGVALLRATGRLDFLTGACMGVEAEALRQIGGWAALADALADDNELGRRIRRAGGTVGIAENVLTLQAPESTWQGWFFHQHRAYVTFRLCNPSGSLGIPLTQGVGLTFLFALSKPFSLVRWLLHFGLLFLRWNSAKALPGDRTSCRELWMVSLLEPFFWLLSWLPVPVRWGGKWVFPTKLGS